MCLLVFITSIIHGSASGFWWFICILYAANIDLLVGKYQFIHCPASGYLGYFQLSFLFYEQSLLGKFSHESRPQSSLIQVQITDLVISRYTTIRAVCSLWVIRMECSVFLHTWSGQSSTWFPKGVSAWQPLQLVLSSAQLQGLNWFVLALIRCSLMVGN